jgi:hypothetical protein
VVISSRTPEGDPTRCPVCGQDCRLEPSSPARDGPCPHCGHLLWFGDTSGPEASDMRSVVLQVLKTRFGPLPPDLEPAITALVKQSGVKRVLDRAVRVPSLADLLAGG